MGRADQTVTSDIGFRGCDNVGDEDIVLSALQVGSADQLSRVRHYCGADQARCDRLIRLVRLAAMQTPPGDVQPADHREVLTPGQQFGRYVVLSHIGSGGMGSVYAAYDNQLERKVALKLLHQHDGKAAQREARLLARVTHPNVVGIHDAGDHAGRPFISMEYVEGITLRQWLAQPRSWSEIFRVMLAAGRGLQAAHGVGVVHRDFKPDNVLLAPDGRVAVSDFGIARLCLAPEDRQSGDTPANDPWSLVGGTPGYMAPEQRTGESTDARTDVFAYCVVLSEALLGDPAPSSQASARRGRSPRWLHAAARRGLAIRPSHRWQSMALLLAHLTFRSRMRVARHGLLACVGLVFAGLGVRTVQQHQTLAQCDRESRTIATVWNATVAETLRVAFLSTAAPYARDAAKGTIDALDRYAVGWRDARKSACVAEAHDQISPEHSASTRQCLDDHSRQLRAMLAGLANPDDTTVAAAPEAAMSLLPPQSCAHLAANTATRSNLSWQDTMHAQRLAHVKATLARRDLEGALLAAQALVRDARAVHDVSTELEAHLAASRALRWLGRYEAAGQHLRSSFGRAIEQELDYLAARAATQLVMLTGSELSRPDQAEAWAELAQGLIKRLGIENDPLQARLAASEGELHRARGEYAAALAGLQRGHRLSVQILGRQHPTSLDLLGRVARVHRQLGDTDAALSIHREILATKEELLGARHPDLATYAGNIAALLMDQGHYDEALPALQRVVEIKEATFGVDAVALAHDLTTLGRIHERLGHYDAARSALGRSLLVWRRTVGDWHPNVATILHTVAALDYSQRDFDNALAGHLRAVEILESVGGSRNPDIAGVLSGVGAAYSAKGEFDAALRTYDRAVSIATAAFGPEHVNVGMLLINLGVVQRKQGHAEQALATLSAALTIVERGLGRSHPTLVEVLRHLCAVHRELGRVSEAVQTCGRAVEIAEAGSSGEAPLARVRFALARTLRKAGSDASRANTLALAARGGFVREDDDVSVGVVDDWLRSETR